MKTNLFFAIPFLLCTTSVFAEWDGTTRTEPKLTQIDKKDYYQISTAEELAWFTVEVARGNGSINAILTADISISSSVLWSPIGGSSKTPFTGKFNGDGHTISNVYFPDTYKNDYVGLFGYIGGNGAVRNLTVKSVNFTSVGAVHYAGGIAGYNEGVIENCTVEGVVNSKSSEKEGEDSIDAVSVISYAGGITGYNAGSISNVSNLATASAITGGHGTGSSADAYVGGIAGMNKGSIFYSKNGAQTLSANATFGVSFAGGLVGYNEGIIKSSFSYSEKIEGMLTGGIVGVLSDGALVGCMYNSTFFGDNKSFGAIGASNGGQDIASGNRSTDNMQTPEFVWIMNTAHNTEGNADVWRYKANNYPVFSEDKNSSSVFVVTFDIQGALVSAFTNTNGTVNIPDVPAPDGQVLDAWYGDKVGRVDSKTIITKDDTLTAKYVSISSSSIIPETKSSSSSVVSSSSKPASSSSVVSSSSKPASSSSVVSSSSKPASSSSVVSSSSKPASSSSVASSSSKPASSSSVASSSSKKDEGKSSSSNKDALPTSIMQQLHISVGPRMLQITGAPSNAAYVITDMQGRNIQSGRVTLSEFTIPVPHAGSYIIRIGSQSKTFRIR